MSEITETHPFPGALTCYRRTQKLLAWMGQNGYVTQVKDRKGKTKYRVVSDEMRTLVDALGKMDEETIKAYLIDPRFINIVHT